MIRHSLRVFVAAVVVFVASDGAGQALPPGARNDEDAIKAVIAATTDAFSRHDAKAWVNLCTPDAQLVTVRGEAMNGVAEIEKGLGTIFQVGPERRTLPSHQELSIRVLVKNEGAWDTAALKAWLG